MAKATKAKKKEAVLASEKTHLKKINLNLLNNGIDFIQSGVRYFLHDEPDPASHKYAILHLFSGLVLLLKERLKREHPSLIFKDVRDVSKTNGKTVDFDEVLSRLESCAAVTFEDKTKTVLRRAQGMRNLAEHYEFVIELQHAQAVIGTLSEVIYNFMRDELKEPLRRHVEPEVWQRMQDLQGIANRIEGDQIENWNRRAEQYSDLDDDGMQDFVERIEPYHPNHNPDPDTFLECPECGEETVVQTDDLDIGVCTNTECKQVCEITSCLRCSTRLTDGSSLCEGCSDYIDRQ